MEQQKSNYAKAKARRKTLKKVQETTNASLKKLDEVNEILADEFTNRLPDYVHRRKSEFQNEFKKYCLAHEDEIADPERVKKLYMMNLQDYLCRSFITSTIRIDGRKYSAVHLRLVSDFYWECVSEIVEKGLTYIPTIQQFARLLGVSVQTLKNYMNAPDDDMRETILMIRDRFVDFYTARSMSRQISEVMSIFTLKAEYNIRDNDTPQTVINNNTISIGADMLEKLRAEESKFGESGAEVKELFDEV